MLVVLVLFDRGPSLRPGESINYFPIAKGTLQEYSIDSSRMQAVYDVHKIC
jgi:hypothetical protein